MKTFKLSLRSVLKKFFRRRRVAPMAESASAKPISARARVRSGIEPLEGRIAPAMLLNGHTLAYTDLEGDLVTVKFSKNIFDLDAAGLANNLKEVFKFDQGFAHTGPADPAADVPQQLQLIDLGRVPLDFVPGGLQSRVAGISVTITAQKQLQNPANPGDDLVAIGAIKAGNNALGVVTVDGDLGQIDCGVGTSKVGLLKLSVQSIGKFGTSTQVPVPTPNPTNPAPDLESRIVGKLGRLTVADDLQGYIHVVDALKLSKIKQRGTIDSVSVGGSLSVNQFSGTLTDNTGRIDAYDIGTVRIGTTSTDGIIGGGGKNSGAVTAAHSIESVTVKGDIVGGAAESSGTIFSGGKLGPVTLGGDLVGAAGVRSGSIEGLSNLGPVSIGGNVTGLDGAASGSIISAGDLSSVTISGNLDGGKGANSGSILAGHNPTKSSRDLGNVTIGGALLGDEGVSSGAIVSGGKIGFVQVGGALQTGLAMQGGIGALSGAIFADGSIEKVKISRGVEGSTGAGSASIQSHGAIGRVDIFGDMIGGTGSESASILAHEILNAARPVAGSIGRVIVQGLLQGAGDRSGLIEADGALGSARIAALEGGPGSYSGAIISGAGFVKPGPTSVISVTGAVEGGSGDHSGYIEIGGRLGSFTAGSMNVAGLRVAEDLGVLKVNGDVIDSIITARGQTVPTAKANVAIGSIEITGSVSTSRILAGFDTLGAGVNADAQIGGVRVNGTWTASTLAAGVIVGTDGLFGTADDQVSGGRNRAATISKIASIVIGGTVEGTAVDGDHFGFVAQQIGSFVANGTPLNLTSATDQNLPPLGNFQDTRVREV